VEGRARIADTKKTLWVLETEWETSDGHVRVVDFMPPREQAADVVRIVEGVSGAVPKFGELRLRFDYGQIVPWVRHDERGIGALAGPDAAYLSTSAPLQGRDLATVSEFTARAGPRKTGQEEALGGRRASARPR
jgi:hypothetical protein